MQSSSEVSITIVGQPTMASSNTPLSLLHGDQHLASKGLLDHQQQLQLAMLRQQQPSFNLHGNRPKDILDSLNTLRSLQSLQPGVSAAGGLNQMDQADKDILRRCLADGSGGLPRGLASLDGALRMQLSEKIGNPLGNLPPPNLIQSAGSSSFGNQQQNMVLQSVPSKPGMSPSLALEVAAKISEDASFPLPELKPRPYKKRPQLASFRKAWTQLRKHPRMQKELFSRRVHQSRYQLQGTSRSVIRSVRFETPKTIAYSV